MKTLKTYAKKCIQRFPALKLGVDLVRAVTAPKEQAALWKDYHTTHKKMAFIREYLTNRSQQSLQHRQQTLLVVLVSDMVYETKLLAMLALAMRLKGWRVIVFMSRLCMWAERYWKAFGIDEFLYWEDITVSPQQFEDSRQAAKTFIRSSMTFQTVKQWTYRSAWIGPQILSSISRELFSGNLNLKDPSVQAILKRLLPQTLETVHKAENVMKKVKPSLLLLNEANYALMGALVDTGVHENIAVIQAVQPSRDDALILKRLTKGSRRMHPASVDRETMDQLEAMQWTSEYEKLLNEEFRKRYSGEWFLQSRNQQNVTHKSREEIISLLSLDPNKKIAIIFAPLLWDANLFYGEDLFEDFGDWFIQTVKVANANPNVNWILKLHPANLWKRAREHVTQELAEIILIREHIGKLGCHIKLLYPNSDISTWSLFCIADYGITVRGTVGMELPCLGVPVFTAGTGRYSNLGFTIDSRTKEEYLEKLKKIDTFPRLTLEQTLRAKKHAYAAFRLKPWEMKSFRAVFSYKKSGVHPLDHNLLVLANSLPEIRENGDLDRFAVWAESQATDYMNSV